MSFKRNASVVSDSIPAILSAKTALHCGPSPMTSFPAFRNSSTAGVIAVVFPVPAAPDMKMVASLVVMISLNTDLCSSDKCAYLSFISSCTFSSVSTGFTLFLPSVICLTILFSMSSASFVVIVVFFLLSPWLSTMIPFSTCSL